MLCEAGRADFAYLRETLELTDGNLSSNISRLQEAGYVRIEKTFEDRRPRTRLTITRAGRAGLDREIAALRELIAALERAPARRILPRPLTDPT